MYYPDWMTAEDIEEFRRDLEAIRREEEEAQWAEACEMMDEMAEV